MSFIFSFCGFFGSRPVMRGGGPSLRIVDSHVCASGPLARWSSAYEHFMEASAANASRHRFSVKSGLKFFGKRVDAAAIAAALVIAIVGFVVAGRILANHIAF